MVYLILTTLVWGFSFALIGSALRGVDPFLVAAMRLGLAFLCFLPFLVVGYRRAGNAARWHLLLIGGVQFGGMYVAYLSAFSHAPAYIVALFSSFTPLWIAFLGVLMVPGGLGRLVLAGVLATAGAVVMRSGQPLEEGSIWIAFLLMQVANLCFGGGQLAWRELVRRRPEMVEREAIGWLYLGGFLVAGCFVLARAGTGTDLILPEGRQVLVIIYLGVVASGWGFFGWNYGASRVSTATLAVANNLVVPLGVILALVFDDRRPDWLLFAVGTACIALALRVARNGARRAGGLVDGPGAGGRG